MVSDSQYDNAIVSLRGTHQAVAVVADPSNAYSGTADTPDRSNIFWSASANAYVIQNLRGPARRYSLTHAGSLTSF
jgi:hypothetical protein